MARGCFGPSLSGLVHSLEADRVFVLIDRAVLTFHQERLNPLLSVIPSSRQLIYDISEAKKNLETCVALWNALEEEGATRHSLLINVGGGVLTDLGGFVASVYKRGIRTINIPTSLMGMVDAAIGGKTGIDRQGIKNEIGSFHFPQAIVIDPAFLRTLPEEELLSGYVEVIKHSLLQGRAEWNSCRGIDPLLRDESMYTLIEESAAFKAKLIAQDPKEGGLRRKLNLGHTIGHAVESLALADGNLPTLSHGSAVLIGLIAEAYVSCRQYGFPSKDLHDLVYWAREYYSPFPLKCKMYDRVIQFAMKDKKNRGNHISYIALRDVGDCVLDATISPDEIREGLDFYRETASIG